MANQRPIRRPPTPRWKRGRGRPVRWLQASFVATDCTTEGFDVPCEPVTPAELLVGELDMPQLDRNSFRIDRIVGTLSFYGHAFRDGTAAYPYLVRFGILAVEDTNRLYQSIDLWDPESVEEYEWMWIEQFTPTAEYVTNDAGLGELAIMKHDIKLDIRTRRSLGQKDSIVLYAQRRTWTDGIGNVNTTERLRYVHNLRCIARV